MIFISLLTCLLVLNTKEAIANCANNCPGSWIGDGYCDIDCYNDDCDLDGGDCDICLAKGCAVTEACHTDCTPIPTSTCLESGCPESFLSDGYCDSQCDSAVCLYDAGDCISAPPTNINQDCFLYGSCQPSEPGNIVCNPGCNNAVCQFDGGDCLASATACIAGGCALSMLADGVCNSVCNSDECGYDGGDCSTYSYDSGLDLSWNLIYILVPAIPLFAKVIFYKCGGGKSTKPMKTSKGNLVLFKICSTLSCLAGGGLCMVTAFAERNPIPFFALAWIILVGLAAFCVPKNKGWHAALGMCHLSMIFLLTTENSESYSYQTFLYDVMDDEVVLVVVFIACFFAACALCCSCYVDVTDKTSSPSVQPQNAQIELKASVQPHDTQDKLQTVTQEETEGSPNPKPEVKILLKNGLSSSNEAVHPAIQQLLNSSLGGALGNVSVQATGNNQFSISIDQKKLHELSSHPSGSNSRQSPNNHGGIGTFSHTPVQSGSTTVTATIPVVSATHHPASKAKLPPVPVVAVASPETDFDDMDIPIARVAMDQNNEAA